MSSGALLFLTLVALTAAGCALSTGLAFRRRLARLERDFARHAEAFQSAIDQLRWQAEAAAQVCRRLERSLETLPQAAPPRAGINLSRRFQVLRLYRRGERPEQIAAALGLPLREVELLLKVHQIAAGV